MFFNKVVVLLVILCLSACGQTPSSPKKNLRFSIQREPDTLDPRKGGDPISATLHFLLYDGLTRLNSDSTVTMSGAQSVRVSQDKTHYVFTLRKTLWSDGKPVTAHDYERSWKKILDPSFPAPNAYLLYVIKNGELAKKGLVSLDEVGVVAQDDYTLSVYLEKPCPHFFSITAFCSLFPFREDTICSNGPFQLGKWQYQSQIFLEKNPLYWQSAQIALDQIQMLVIPDSMTALQLYEQNYLDVIAAPLSSLPIDALEKLRSHVEFHRVDGAGTCFCVFNSEKHPFHNQNLRKAFGLALNRQAMITHITQLNEKIATGIIPPCFKKNAPALFVDADITKAQELFEKALEELSLTRETFPVITYFYPYSESNHLLAQFLKQEWQEHLGISIQLQSQDTKTLLEKLATGDFQASQASSLAQYFDCMNFLERFHSKQNRKNYARWENTSFNDLLDLSYSASPTKRMELLLQAEQIFIEDMPIIPLFHKTFGYLIKPHVQNIEFTPMGSLYFEKLSISSTSEKEL